MSTSGFPAQNSVLLSLAALCVIEFSAAQPAGHQILSLPDYGGAMKSNNYGGYVDIGNGQKSYYYFVESERSPSTDPLVLWLNGGPGCSSLLGLFTEIGPYQLRHGGKFYNNSYTWAAEANVLFVESPAGVGFSVDKTPPTNWTDALTAELNYKFLQKWLTMYPAYAGRDFYISGESYAGHYVPQLASQIHRGSDTQLKSMMKGFMVGNPCTGEENGNGDWCFKDDPTLGEWYQGHAFQSFDSTLNNPYDIDEWGFLTNADFDPYDVLERYCYLQTDLAQAKFATSVRGSERRRSTKLREQSAGAAALERMMKRRRQQMQSSPEYISSPQPRQSLRKGGGALPTYGACSDYYLNQWLNRPDVQAALHATVGTAWSSCADIVYPTYTDSPGVKPIYIDLMENTNWKLLVYSGTADTVVNFIQTEKVLISFNRPALTNFTPWYFQDRFNASWRQLGGFYVQYDRVSWASVKGAGHMVPTYVPAAAQQLFHSFIRTGTAGLPPVRGEPSPSHGIQPPLISHYKHTVSRKEGLTFLGGIVLGIFVAVILVVIQRRCETKGSRKRALEEKMMEHESPQFDTPMVRR